MSFKIFINDNGPTEERYRSIGAFSITTGSVDRVDEDIRRILSESGIREFQWEHMQSAPYGRCAKKIVDYILDKIDEFRIRIDVVVWDSHLGRPPLTEGRLYDDVFLRLVQNTIEHRAPDEDWTIDRTNSSCCQIAGMFAGLAAFSRRHARKISIWTLGKRESKAIVAGGKKPEYTTRDRECFALLGRLNRRCKARSLGVSLKSCGFLWTPNPERPVNFWHYKPPEER